MGTACPHFAARKVFDADWKSGLPARRQRYFLQTDSSRALDKLVRNVPLAWSADILSAFRFPPRALPARCGSTVESAGSLCAQGLRCGQDDSAAFEAIDPGADGRYDGV